MALAAGTLAAVFLSSGAQAAAGSASPAGQPQARPPRPSLPEGNLRVLTPAQTRRLFRYAEAVDACFARNGIATVAPVARRRTITVETRQAVGIRRLVRIVESCSGRLGDPPSPSSLQAVDARTVVLSVPKQCLLDPKTRS
jgi:hypothetical protein